MPCVLAGYLSGEAKSLVKALLEKDAVRRLGSGATGAAAVKAHPFFRRINWQALTARQVGLRLDVAWIIVPMHAAHALVASMCSRVPRLCDGCMSLLTPGRSCTMCCCGCLACSQLANT